MQEENSRDIFDSDEESLKNVSSLIKRVIMPLSKRTVVTPLHNLYLALRSSRSNLPCKQEKMEIKWVLGTTSLCKAYRKLSKFMDSLTRKEKETIRKNWDKKYGNGDFNDMLKEMLVMVNERKEKNKQSKEPLAPQEMRIFGKEEKSENSTSSSSEEIISIEKPKVRKENKNNNSSGMLVSSACSDFKKLNISSSSLTKIDEIPYTGEFESDDEDERIWNPPVPENSPAPSVPETFFVKPPTAESLLADHEDLYGGRKFSDDSNTMDVDYNSGGDHMSNKSEHKVTQCNSPKPSSPLPCPDPEDDEHNERNFQAAIKYSDFPISNYCDWSTFVPSYSFRNDGDDSLNEFARLEHSKKSVNKYRNYHNGGKKWKRKIFIPKVPIDSNEEVYHPISPSPSKSNPALTYEELNDTLEKQIDLTGGGRRTRAQIRADQEREEEIKQEDYDITESYYGTTLLEHAQNLPVPPFNRLLLNVYRRTIHINSAWQLSFVSFVFNYEENTAALPWFPNPWQQYRLLVGSADLFAQRVLGREIASHKLTCTITGVNQNGDEIQHHGSSAFKPTFDEARNEIVRYIENAFAAYTDYQYAITQWEYQVVPTSNLIIGGESMSQLNLSKHIEKKMGELRQQWYVINPSSRNNCLWTAVAIASNYRTSPKLITKPHIQNKAGFNLKSKSGASSKKVGTNEDIQTLANYKHSIIQVWNHLNTITATFYPNETLVPIATLNILLYGGHFYSLLPKACPIAAEHCSKIEPVVKKLEQIKKLEREYKDKLIVVYDIETYRQPEDENENVVKQMAYAISWCFKCEDQETADEAENLGYTIYYYDWFRNEQWVEMIVAVKEEIGNVNDEQNDCLDVCLDRAVDSWLTHPFFHKAVFYAHNGGKFDIRILMGQSKLMHRRNYCINGERTIELNGRIINMEVSNKDIVFEEEKEVQGKKQIVNVPHTIQIKDSLPLFGPGSGLAKLGKELKTHHKKLEEQINVHALQYKDTWRRNWHEHNLSRYLLHDVLCLLESLIVFNDIVKEQTGIPITAVNTGASLSKKYYLSKFYPGDKNNSNKVYTLTEDFDQFIRESYGGGRCEIFYHGLYEGNIYYYDFTSLYPDVGRKDMPVGKPRYLVPPEKLGEERWQKILKDRWRERVEWRRYEHHLYFWKVKVWSPLAQLGTPTDPEVAKPLFGIKEKGMYVFRWFTEPTEMVLFEPEIEFARRMKLDYEFEPINAVMFNQAPILKEAMETMFKNKQQADAEGKKGLAKTYKILVNSLYGVWGLKTLDREGVEIAKPEMSSWCLDLAQGKLMDIERIGEYIVTRRTHDLEVTDCNVAIAAAVTSYARMKLYLLFADIILRGGKILYCDTDSVITTKHIEIDKPLCERYMLDENKETLGKDLGKLKNEIVDCYEKYPDLKPQDHFTRAVLVAPKLYYIEGADPRIFKKANKGYKEDKENGDILTFDRMYTLVNMYLPFKERKVEQETVQWIGGNKGLMTEDIGVKNVKRKKELRPYVRKGKLVGNNVIPYNNLAEVEERLQEIQLQQKKVKQPPNDIDMDIIDEEDDV